MALWVGLEVVKSVFLSSCEEATPGIFLGVFADYFNF